MDTLKKMKKIYNLLSVCENGRSRFYQVYRISKLLQRIK